MSRDPEGRLRGKCANCVCAAYSRKSDSHVCKCCPHVARDHVLLKACHKAKCNCPECWITDEIPGECANCGHEVTAHTPAREMKVAKTSSHNDNAVPSTSSFQPAGSVKKTRTYQQWMADEDSEDEFDKNLKSNKKKKEGDRKGFYRKGKGLAKGRSGRLKKLSISLLSGNGTTVAHSSFGLDVPLYASEGRVLELAAQKLIATRKVDEESAGHLLLCEGEGSWLKYVPGTKQLFVVKDYLEFRNLPSSKIHLYVMTRENYIVLQKSKDRQDRDKHWKEARLLLDDELHTEDTDNSHDVEIVDKEICFNGPGKPRSSSTPTDDSTMLWTGNESSEDPNEDWWRARSERVPVTDHDFEIAMELQQFYDNEEAKFAADEDDADQNASREQTEEPSVVLVATSMTKEEKRKLRNLVHDLNHKNIQDPENSKLYTIRRDKAWENFVDNISLKTFNECRPMEIKFIGEEETVDTGGPRNEMFRLAFIDIFETSGLFEPSQIGFLPISSAMSVADEQFLKVGKMMALSIVHLGPTPAFLHPAVVAGICGRKLPATAMSPFQPVDGETAAFVNKLESATQETVVSLFESEVGLVMRGKVGWKKPAGKATMGDAALLRNLLCLEDLVLSRKSAIDQLRQGLKLFDLLHVLEREPQLSGALLQKSMKPVSADDIKRTLDVHWAAEGSNKKERQKDLYERLTKWLDSVEEGDGRVSLGDFLTFITAMDAEPQIGWALRPILQFCECPEGCRCLPVSNTCAATITMPEHMGTLPQEDFRATMEEAVVSGLGFGRV